MMKNLRYTICTWVGAVALMLLLFSSSAVCENNPTVTMSALNSKEVGLLSSTCNDINTEIVENSKKTGIKDNTVKMLKSEKAENSGAVDGEYIVNVEFNVSTYNRLKQTEKEAVMESILLGIENSQLSQISKSKIYNFVSNSDEATSNLVRQLSSDVKADFGRAYSSFKPFTGWIGWILGLLTLGLFLTLGLTIAVDLTYIGIPLVQNWLSQSNESVRPKYVSLEAWNAVKAAEGSIGSGRYREPMGVYFKAKTKQFLALGLCLLYLISGQIYNIIAQVIDMFNEVVQ